VTSGATVDLAAVQAAAALLDGVAHRTPVLRSPVLDEASGATLALKAEHLQRIGAFKFRGAYHALARLAPQVLRRGVVAYSSGNHAQAVACAAALLGVDATIVMPRDAPAVKLDGTRRHGATVVLYDRHTEDRAAIATSIARERRATLIPPFDDPDVVAGQGTVALELLEQTDHLDVLVVPLSGGGLLAGCAVVAAARAPETLVVGVEPAVRRAGRDALARGEVVEGPVPTTVLDGQRTTGVGALPLRLMRGTVHAIVGVTDDESLAAMRALHAAIGHVVEPSGASGLAAVLAGRLGTEAGIDVRGRRVGVVLSGGNADPEVLRRASIGG
jgi:threonine dehydratase